MSEKNQDAPSLKILGEREVEHLGGSVREHVILDLRDVRSSLTMDVGITEKQNLKKN